MITGMQQVNFILVSFFFSSYTVIMSVNDLMT